MKTKRNAKDGSASSLLLSLQLISRAEDIKMGDIKQGNNLKSARWNKLRNYINTDLFINTVLLTYFICMARTGPHHGVSIEAYP